ncbi:MAG TPA: BON domain-containing protein [Solirubrobacteraceae bacterium]|nr:BON domain-containing protein [Solirubrobacteraceae bacterium]
MSRLFTLLLGVGAAAAAAKYFSDSSHRKQLSYAAGKVKGAVATATPSVPGMHKIEDVDDVTLARKVESEIFRSADAPKGDVSIDVQAGVVHLRGTVAEDAWIERFADDAKKVDGVKGVKNLLHRPGTPAPTAEPRAAVQDRL